MTFDCPQPDVSWSGRAFVVQLSVDACPSAGRFCGRVQHLRTEDAIHFDSLEELARFISLHAAEPARAGSAAGLKARPRGSPFSGPDGRHGRKQRDGPSAGELAYG